MFTGEDVGLLMMLSVIAIGTPVVLFFYWFTERKTRKTNRRPRERMPVSRGYNPGDQMQEEICNEKK